MDNNNYSITHLKYFQVYNMFILSISRQAFRFYTKVFFLADTHQTVNNMHRAIWFVYSCIFSLGRFTMESMVIARILETAKWFEWLLIKAINVSSNGTEWLALSDPLTMLTFAPRRKSYRIGPLFTHNNGDFGAISVTERSCAAPIFKVESHISEGYSYYTA